ncbi:hypothetical protein ACH5RR_014917 [Cinchona calisaya]|uniref:Gnk2-homologous domain-containing protein n=1 Tax=Cinchona calisaya TaxID=153742 RepID=A0ABD2ZSU3_9GENT
MVYLLSFNSAQELLLDKRCGNNTTNTAYQANLNFVLSTLSSNASRAANGFYNATAGAVQDPSNAVYGLFLCRGDISNDACQQCVASASREILQLCPNAKTAVVWFDTCLLRYSSESIFSRLDDSNPITQYSAENVTETDKFNQALVNTMDEIAQRAADDGSSGKYFAVQEADYSEFNSLYALGQCTPDLSSVDCRTCLTNAISVLPNCCLSRLGARILFPSCNIRFENWRFYKVNATTAVPQGPATKKDDDGGISTRTIVAIVVPTVVIVAIVLFLVAFYIARRSRRRYDAWKQWRNGTPLALLDPTIGDSFERNEVILSIHIGLLCAQEDVEKRPNMASIVLMLNSFSATRPAPGPPAFFINWPIEVSESDKSIGIMAAPASVNEASVTEPYPR